MIKKKVIIGTLSLMALPSCVSYSRIEHEEPTAKKFQNAETARIFYEAEFVREENITGENDQSISISIGLQSPIAWGRRVTDQKRVNDAFRAADFNGNGVLSLTEARKFADSKRSNLGTSK